MSVFKDRDEAANGKPSNFMGYVRIEINNPGWSSMEDLPAWLKDSVRKATDVELNGRSIKGERRPTPSEIAAMVDAENAMFADGEGAKVADEMDDWLRQMSRKDGS